MGTRLYIGHLSFNTTAETLTAVFGQDGRNVKSVELVKERDTGRSRGFAFVDMASDTDAQAAISALDGTEVDGWKIQVTEARAKATRPAGGGPGGGRAAAGRGQGGSSRGDRGRAMGRLDEGRGGGDAGKRKEWRERRERLDDDDEGM